ncbi:MAG: helix-turn-helix domain-containing protein [Candidatus Omnitrophota bacterium]
MTTLDREKFKFAIRNYRIEKDLTQSELARRLLTTTTTIARWELGLSVPKNARMIQELKDLGIRI